MKGTKWGTILLAMVCMLAPIGGAGASSAYGTPSTGQIYLYGEQHGIEAILDKEFEIWQAHYADEGLRHLFVEYPYYTAEFLNLWMQAGDDTILDQVYEDLKGTAAQVPALKAFLKKIKENCPETLFCGTDVGHQYETTGKRYVAYLKAQGLEDSEQDRLAKECIAQGQQYYQSGGDAYRENMMAQNFIRAFDALNGASVMGIYGSAHTGLAQMNQTGEVPCMANQLAARYGAQVSAEDLSWVRGDIAPLRRDSIEVSGKTYEASYFGRQDLTGFRDFACRDFWRLENAYADLKDAQKTGDVLPYSEYPMQVEPGQVFVIDYTMTDGSVMRLYYRSDGAQWQGAPATENFTPHYIFP
jgi:hypothetical protein